MRWLCALLATGCSFTPGQLGTGDASLPTDDTRPIDGVGCTTFSSQLDTCVLTQPETLTLSGDHTFDTDSGMLVDDNNASVPVDAVMVTGGAGPMRVLVVDDLELGASSRLRATGSLPFAIVAFGTVRLADGAVIDVSNGGAGARTACATNAAGTGMPTSGESGGGGGGGGGGFGAAGGNGGIGDSDGDDNAGGVGGGAVSQPAGPLGGCPGATGGFGDNAPGTGGAGGGAVYIVAATQITIGNGGIHAGGGPGTGGRRTGGNFGDAGGGGGGSGGMIWLESPIVRSTGTLAANGGGGGEGSGNSSQGDDGDPAALSTARAAGGSGDSPTGTDGGRGGARGNLAGESVTNSQAGGGGGGGGGVGFVVVTSPDQMLGTNVSP